MQNTVCFVCMRIFVLHTERVFGNLMLIGPRRDDKQETLHHYTANWYFLDIIIESEMGCACGPLKKYEKINILPN